MDILEERNKYNYYREKKLGPLPIVGFCTSRSCAKEKNARGLAVTDNKKLNDCPYCGEILVWRKLRTTESIVKIR